MCIETRQSTPLTHPDLSGIKTLLAVVCFAIIAFSVSGCQTSTGLTTDTTRQGDANTAAIVTATSKATLPSPKPTQPSQQSTKIDTIVVVEEDDGSRIDDEYLESYDDSPDLSGQPSVTSSEQDNTVDGSATQDTQLFEDDALNNQTSDRTDNQHPDNAHSTNPVENNDSEYLTEESDESPVIPSTIHIAKPQPDAKTVQQIMLERARQNSKYANQSKRSIEDGSDIPAFRKLMDTGVMQLKQGQVSAAQSTFTRAQRLAPQSSAVYFYLGQVALKQNQPLKAEAMARRGLVVAQSKARKSALWQLILKAGQLQGNQKIINEAKVALASL